MFRVFINFKTYEQATGERAVELAKIIQEVGERFSSKEIEIIPIVQVADLCQVVQAVKIPVWVQHIDPFPPGKFTGFASLEAVSGAGATGVLLNHSEHPLPPGTIKQVLARVREKNEKFETMIAAKTLGQLEKLVKLRPDFVAYEIAELIGGKVSITEANPKAIKNALKLSGKVPLIVGAGVNKPQDLAKAADLGAKGVLVASFVVLAENQEEELEKLLSLI